MGLFKLIVRAIQAMLFFKAKSDTVIDTAVKIAQTVETVETTSKLAKDIARQAEEAAEAEIKREVEEAAQKAATIALVKVEQVGDIVEKKLSTGISNAVSKMHAADDLIDVLNKATKR